MFVKTISKRNELRNYRSLLSFTELISRRKSWRWASKKSLQTFFKVISTLNRIFLRFLGDFNVLLGQVQTQFQTKKNYIVIIGTIFHQSNLFPFSCFWMISKGINNLFESWWMQLNDDSMKHLRIQSKFLIVLIRTLDFL